MPESPDAAFSAAGVAALLSLTLLASPGLAGAQVADTVGGTPGRIGIVDTVLIVGNRITKDYVILDEMTIRPGMIATSEEVEYDRDRIYSLGLFTSVDIYYDTLGTTHFLLVNVRERWYIIPYPIFGFRDGDPKRLFYGFGILHNNFRGMNQKVYASAVFGFNPSLALSYLDPLFIRSAGMIFSIDASYGRVRNKSIVQSDISGDFDETHYNADIMVGRRFGLYHTAGVSLGYQVVQVPTYHPGLTVAPSGRDKFLYSSLFYQYDTRDLREYPSRGSFYNLYIAKFGFSESALNFSRAGADLRRYIPLPLDLTLAGRLFGSVVWGGEVPTYSHVYFGYGERIRGEFSTVYEGEDQAGATVELRYALMKPKVFRFTAVPLPEQFAVWRFGISLALFGDAGAVWYRGDTVHWSSFASGYGAGVDLLLPYSYVVRLEYAYNRYFRGQFVLDLRGNL